MSPDFYARADQLAAAGRWAELVHLVEPVVEQANDPGLWSMVGFARLRLGRRDAAADALVRSARLDPEGGRAWLNAAAVLADCGRAAEAGEAAAGAIRMGFSPPEAHLLLGRGRKGAGDFTGAETAFHAAIAARPTLADAHRELAQLVWMRTGDLVEAGRALDTAIIAHPGDAGLRAERTRLLNAAGAEAEARAEAARIVSALPAGPGRFLYEAHEANLAQDYGRARRAAEQALSAGAPPPQALEALAAAQLGLGDAHGMLAAVDQLRRTGAGNQLSIAYEATALRMLDDPRAAPYRDYEALVRVLDLDVPPGWSDLPSYLADLAATLEEMHPFQTHPLDQSVRHGSQTLESLIHSDRPAVRAFFQAIDGPIRRYLEHLGPGGDPLRARNRGTYDIKGCWSVWLRSGGFHVDHVHPQGWISSACYIATPEAVMDETGRQGWIGFGRPAIQPPGGLPAEHFVQPRPGRLVLFPAWMWHGTVPFTTDERRLTVAFDVLPG